MGGVSGTSLDALTGLEASGIVQRCNLLLRKRTEPSKWAAPGVPDARAGAWPADVQEELASLVVGLATRSICRISPQWPYLQRSGACQPAEAWRRMTAWATRWRGGRLAPPFQHHHPLQKAQKVRAQVRQGRCSDLPSNSWYSV